LDGSTDPKSPSPRPPTWRPHTSRYCLPTAPTLAGGDGSRPRTRTLGAPQLSVWPREATVQCTIKKTAIHSSDEETPPIVGCDALLALANWIERRRQHDPAKALQDLVTRAPSTAAAPYCPAESDGHPAPGQARFSGGDAP